MLLTRAGVGASRSCAADVEGDRAGHRKMCARGDSTEVRTTEIDSAVQRAAAEAEQSLLAERVRAGLRNARARGEGPGRPRIAVDAPRVAFLRAQRRPEARSRRSWALGKGTTISLDRS